MFACQILDIHTTQKILDVHIGRDGKMKICGSAALHVIAFILAFRLADGFSSPPPSTVMLLMLHLPQLVIPKIGQTSRTGESLA